MIRIDLDQNATAPLEPAVADAMAASLSRDGGNPSSLHAAGRRARERIEEARESVAAWIGARAEEVLFVSGGTEANNLAIEGTWRRIGGGLLISSIEHLSGLECAAALDRRGAVVHRIDPRPSGAALLEDLIGALTEARPSLVSLMLANNETGCLQPVAGLAAAAHARGALVHTDAVQAAGKMPIRVGELDVDLLTVSAHKIGGPKGVGALWIRPGAAPESMIRGGGQEGGRRAGTENVAAIVGFGRAARIAASRSREYREKVAPLRDAFEAAILDRLPDARVLGNEVERIANTSLIAFPGVEGAALVQLLDLKGIHASTGAACEAGSSDFSHVLSAMRIPDEYARGAIRFSMGFHTTEAELASAARVVVEAVRELSDR